MKTNLPDDSKRGFIELKLEVYKESIEQDEYTKRFNRPIFYYLKHKKALHIQKSPYTMLSILFIINFRKGEITYLNLYTPENIKEFKENPVLRQVAIYGDCSPHSVITIRPEEDFYVFNNACNYFYYINIKKKIARIITTKCLGLEDEDKNLIFTSTNSKKYDDKNSFYMGVYPDNIVPELTGYKTYIFRHKSDARHKVYYYLSSLDLSEIKKVYGTPAEKIMHGQPHSVLNYKNKLLITELYTTKVKLADKGLEFKSLEEFYNFVIKDVLDRENPSRIIKMLKYILNRIHGGMTFKEFKTFCLKKGYKFEILSGTIRMLDILSKEEEEYSTVKSNSGHFEIDDKEGFVYVSAHNLDFFRNKLGLFGLASIDKFKLKEDGKLTHMGAFMDPKGYRFTSHRFFRYENKPYIATFGYPSRLFIIDAKTMTLLVSQDIGEDFLSDNEEINDLMKPEIDNTNVRVITMEVSDDGSVILFFLGDCIYLYDFPQRKLVKKIEYKKNISSTNKELLHEFSLGKGHSCYTI